MEWLFLQEHPKFDSKPSRFWPLRGIGYSRTPERPSFVCAPTEQFIAGPVQLDGWFVWFNLEFFQRVIHINEHTSILNRKKLQRLPKVSVDTLIAVYRAVEANQKELGKGKYRFAQVAAGLGLSSARKAQKYYERAHRLILRD